MLRESSGGGGGGGGYRMSISSITTIESIDGG